MIDLQHSILSCYYDVIILSETWLNKDFSEGEVGLKDFQVYRSDRNTGTSDKSRGGGVLIAVHKHLKSTLLKHLLNSVEQLFIEIHCKDKNIIIGAVYIPPAANVTIYEDHCNTVDDMLYSHPHHKLILCGDYNIPDATWDNDQFGLIAHCDINSKAFTLSNSFSFYNLYQMNNIANSRNVFLDLLFTHFNDIQVRPAQDLLLPNSAHHTAISFDLDVRVKMELQYEEWYFDYRNGDYYSLNNYFAGVQWDKYIDSVYIDNCLSNLYDIIYSGINAFIPIKRYKTSTFPKWFNSELRKLIIEKKKAHKIYKDSLIDEDYEIFSHLRAQCKNLTNRCYREYLTKTENNIHRDPRQFWKFINDQNKVHSVPNTMSFRDKLSLSGEDSVNLFAEFFSSVYVQNNINVVPDYNFNINIDLMSCSIDLISLVEAINNLPNKLSYGPDGVPAYFLKNCVYTLAKPLHAIFNKSLSLGIFPTYWKHSFIIPIFKSGLREDVENYRGICIQSEIPKLFDSLITQQIYSSCKNIIVSNQHGFCQGRSTTTNLLIYHNHIVNALENRLQVDSIYTDFSKAFDRVDLKLLPLKLQALGLGGNLLKWLESFLVGRTQSVKLGNFISYDIDVLSGVPQGSHCGPVLFILFINDIVSHIKYSEVLLFADDLKLFRSIKSEDDAILLQKDVDSLHNWCLQNSMALNIKKCFSITFSKSNSQIFYPYAINNDKLLNVTEIRDLGVNFDSKLTFDSHLITIISKSLKSLGFIIRSSTHFSTQTIKMIYCSLVRSSLEYCSIVWSPYYNVHIDNVEKVQKKFLRYIAYKQGITRDEYEYRDILVHLNISTLEQRRCNALLLFLHKLLNGNVDSPQLLGEISLNSTSRLTRNKFLFHIPFHSTNYGYHSPLSNMLRLGNTYNNLLDLFNPSLNSFKSKLRRLNQ